MDNKYSKILKAVSSDEFNNIVKIKFSNIDVGFNNFTNGILENNREFQSKENIEKNFIRFIEEACILNDCDKVIIDFYLNKLNEEEIKNLYSLLEEGDKEILKDQIDFMDKKNIYFQLDCNLIPFIVKLNTRELFFSTIYFTKFPCTLWGNYNMKFPIFFDNMKFIDLYKDLAEKNNLNINCINLKNKKGQL